MKYLVDVFRTYAKCIEVEADSGDEAEEIAYQKAASDELDLADFILTDDIETECCGIVNENGEKEYD